MAREDAKLIVLLTDRAWPDDKLERAVIESAGFGFVSGPADPAPAETIERLVATHRPSAILSNWAPVSARAIECSDRLRLVARMGVGLDNIDVDAATGRGVYVTNVPDYCVDEVSDHAVGLVLSWARGISVSDRDVRAGRWCPAAVRPRRLSNLTCGVVGYGRTGKATATKLRALGAGVLVFSRSALAISDGFEVVTFENLLVRSDVLSLHIPLTNETRHLMGRRELGLMPAGSFLVNVSRGGLVDSSALIASLEAGHLSGAGLDVIESEPHVPQQLLVHPGVVITPHIAFSSDAAVADLRRTSAEEVVRVLRGRPPLHPSNRPTVSVCEK